VTFPANSTTPQTITIVVNGTTLTSSTKPLQSTSATRFAQRSPPAPAPAPSPTTTIAYGRFQPGQFQRRRVGYTGQPGRRALRCLWQDGDGRLRDQWRHSHRCIAFAVNRAIDAHGLGSVIDLQGAGAADAKPAHLPGHQRRMELTPPLAVRMPSAAIIPRKSSGDVSLRTSSTF